jgi:hypothetical protein
LLVAFKKKRSLGGQNGSFQECEKVLPKVSNAGGFVALAVAKSAKIIKKVRVFAVSCAQKTRFSVGCLHLR